MLAVVLAGGLGTRLRSQVRDWPKCMAPVAGRPFLEWVIHQLRCQGVDRVVLAIGHKGGVIRRHFQDGALCGVRCSYADEGRRLRGTGGAIAGALRASVGGGDEFVLVTNGDTLVDFELDVLQHDDLGTKGRLTLVAAEIADATRYGRLELGPGGAVTAFGEKAFAGRGLVNAGVYIARRAIFESVLPDEERFSFEHDVLPRLVGRGLHAVVTKGTFIDIGLPADYKRAQRLLAGRAKPCP